MPLLFDKLVKGPVFGCQQCGQCLLSQTAYVCPMTCPKGLRNGPCGGTLDGACEVLPDQPCVWVRIRDKTDAPPEGFHAPFESSLIGTSSWSNYFRGRDKGTRELQPFRHPDQNEQTEPRSVFAERFATGKPIITYEITSPRSYSGLAAVERAVAKVHPYVDAINTTTNAGGVPSLHSLETARVVARTGVPPIVQFCGRDHDPADFARQAKEALQDGFANLLVLTGDWNPATKRERNPQHWFPMDSLQMVDVLAQHRGFVKAPFIGVASNAYTKPMEASVARFIAKASAGAHFTQTQAVTEVKQFSRWLNVVQAQPAGKHCRILASVPLVGKPKPFSILRRLPGVYISPGMVQALEGADDLAQAGLSYARDLIRALLCLDIDGIHLMNFGVPIDAVIDLIAEIKD